MRIRTVVTVICLLAAVPAFGASRSAHRDCNSDDADRMIKGCTRIIEDTSESEKVRSIAYVSRALAWKTMNQREKALSDFGDAIRLNPDDALPYNNRAILYRELGEIDRAIADFDEAIRRNPQPRSDLTGPGFVNVYTNRGLAWHAKGEYERALADYDKGISLDANDQVGRYHRGQVHLSLGNHALAVADLDVSIRLDPKQARAYYLRGLARYNLYMSASEWIKKEDLEGAIADFSEVIALDPNDAFARYMRARARLTNGDRDAAIADLIDASQLEPMNAKIREALKELKPDYEPPKESLLTVLKRHERAK